MSLQSRINTVKKEKERLAELFLSGDKKDYQLEALEKLINQKTSEINKLKVLQK